MKLEKQKKWGQPLDYAPDFYAIEDEKEDHVAEQFKELWQSAKTPLMVLFCIAAISGWAIWL